MASANGFDSDSTSGAQSDDKPSPKVGVMSLGDVKVKLEPVDTPAESAMESLSAVSPQLPLGIHHRMRVYSRSTQSTSPETFVCEVCQGEFPYQEMLQTHKLLHFNTRHVCYACDCYFLKAETLVLHVATIHNSLSVLSQNHKGEIFVCSICLQRFSSKKILTKHENLHAVRDQASFSCKICALDFIGYRALLAHLNSPRHREMKVKIQSIFVCVDCRSIFASRDSYAMHMMVRAQNETCDMKNLNTLPVLHKGDVDIKMEAPSPSNSSDLNGSYGHQDDVTSPLNLSKSTHERRSSSSLGSHNQHKCNRCNESFGTQDALAMHVMLHAKSEAEDEHQLSIQTKLEAALLARQAALLQAVPLAHGRHVSSNLPLSLLALQSNNLWPCSLCQAAFDSCDMLAMHVMEKHASGQHRSSLHHSSNPSFVNHNAARHSLNTSLSIEAKATEAVSQMLKELQNKMERAQAVGNHSNQSHLMIDTQEKEATALFAGKKRRLSLSHLDFMNHSSKEEVSLQEKRCKSADYYMEAKSQLPVIDLAKKLLMNDEHKSLQCDMCIETFESKSQLHSHFKSASHMEKMLEAMKSKQLNDEFEGKSDHLSRHSEKGRADTSTEKAGGSDFNQYSMKESNKNVAYSEPQQSENDRGDGHASYSIMARRSRRKLKHASRISQSACQSPESSDLSPWMDSSHVTVHPSVSSMSDVAGRRMSGLMSPNTEEIDPGRDELPVNSHSGTPHHSPRVSSSVSPISQASKSGGRDGRSEVKVYPGTASTPPEGVQDADLLEYILGHVDNLVMCRFCGIIFTDRTMYYLHMGLHNVNNPWQCNLCGKVCSGVHQFSSHVIHY